MNRTSTRRTALAAGIVFSILWPSASTATKIALAGSQPFNICFVRFACAGLIMVIISHAILRLRLPRGREWRRLAISGWQILPDLECVDARAVDRVYIRRDGHGHRRYLVGAPYKYLN